MQLPIPKQVVGEGTRFKATLGVTNTDEGHSGYVEFAISQLNADGDGLPWRTTAATDPAIAMERAHRHWTNLKTFADTVIGSIYRANEEFQRQQSKPKSS